MALQTEFLGIVVAVIAAMLWLFDQPFGGICGCMVDENMAVVVPPTLEQPSSTLTVHSHVINGGRQ